MTTKEKLTRLLSIISDAGMLVPKHQKTTKKWLQDKGIIETIQDTLKEKLSHVEVTECNRIYKTWTNYINTEGNTPTNLTHDFHNKQFVFTGFRDEKLTNILANQFNSVVNSNIRASSNIDYLICKDARRTTVKMKRAKQIGAVILTYEELKKLIKI